MTSQKEEIILPTSSKIHNENQATEMVTTRSYFPPERSSRDSECFRRRGRSADTY